MEEMGRTIIFVSIIIIVFLIIAIMPIKAYGFYILLRWICCPCLLIISNYYRLGEKNILSVLFLLLALIYNPIFPLHLGRSIWVIINIVTLIIAFFFNLVFKKLKNR